MRQYIRHPTEMPIHYWLSDNADASTASDLVNDISTSGLSFHSTYRIKPGSSISIRIDVKPPPFIATGNVVWCRREKKGYLVGVNFNDLDIEFSMRMVEQVCYIEQYRREILRKEGRRMSSEQAAVEWISQFAGSFPV